MLVLSLVVIGYFLYFSRLGTLLPGYSAPELQTLSGSSDWHAIVHNPINAPYKILSLVLILATHHSLLATRIVSAGFGIAFVLLFYVIVRAWCSYRVAYLSTIMFATSGGLLHFARFGTGDILQMSVLALVALGLWYRKERKHRAIIGYLLVLLFVTLWYVPGMVWFEILGLLPLGATIRGQLRRSRNIHIVSLVVVLLAAVAPLSIACASSPGLLLQVLGLPSSLNVLPNIGSNLYRLMADIVVYGTGNPLLWVGHAPLLSTVEVVAAAIGAYWAYRNASIRSTFLFGSLAIGLALASLRGAATFACLVPILYLLVALGLDRFMDTWLAVFPRNPFARYTGVGVLVVLVAFSVLYQVRSYYVAWPHSPATRAIYSHRAT